jgi:hypothetical protein
MDGHSANGCSRNRGVTKSPRRDNLKHGIMLSVTFRFHGKSFMDDALCQQWWPLHRRVALGEQLNAEEQARYEAGLRVMERDEHFSSTPLAERLSALEALATERGRLLARQQQIDAEIASLQSSLTGEYIRLPSGIVIPVDPRPAPRVVKRPTIHYTELTDLPPDNPLYTEWKTYRHELPRLLAEGHEGKFILIKGTSIIGLYSSDREANVEGCRRFLMQSFLIQQILTEEPILFVSPHCHPCRS